MLSGVKEKRGWLSGGWQRCTRRWSRRLRGKDEMDWDEKRDGLLCRARWDRRDERRKEGRKDERGLVAGGKEERGNGTG